MKPKIQLPYKASQIRGLYRLGARVYWAGVGLLLIAAVLAFIGLILDPFTFSERYDPAARRSVFTDTSSLRAFRTATILGAIGLGSLGLLLQIGGALAFLVLLYRCWHVIQDSKVRASPGAAVGLLFVPVFNFYWMFVAFVGLAKDLNKFIRRHEVSAPYASTALAKVVCVYQAIAVIPFFGVPTAIVNIFVFPLMYGSFAQTTASIIERWRDRGEEAIQESPCFKASIGTNTAGVIAPLGVALLIIGLVVGGFYFTEGVRYQRYLGVQSEELSHLQSQARIDQKTTSRIKQLESSVKFNSEQLIPSSRNYFLLGAALTLLGTIAIAGAVWLVYVNWPREADLEESES